MLPEPAWIRARLAELLPAPGTPVPAADLEHLCERVYTAVHTRRDPELGSFSANRAEFGRITEQARAALADLTFTQQGLRLVRAGDTESVVRCPEGVEFRVPAEDVRPEYLGFVALRLRALACPAESRWLHWRRPGVRGGWDARIYLHARAEAAVEVWAGLVRALEGLGLDFTTKIGGSTEMLHRADGIVVYLAAADLPRVLPLLDGADLLDPVAGFSHRAGPGTGVALDPGDLGPVVGSVGYHWSRALVTAWCGDGDVAAELDRLARSWERAAAALAPAGVAG